ELRAYLRWRAIDAAAPALGKKFVDENFRMEQALRGAKQLLPRWKRCVEMTDAALGFASGRTFVAETMGEQGKTIAREMITVIEDAFGDGLGTLSWMDDAAKKASAEKLHKIDNKVGFP